MKLQEISQEYNEVLLEVHEGLQTAQELTDSEILQEACASVAEEEEEEEDDDSPLPTKVPASQAVDALEVAVQWLEELPGTDNQMKLQHAYGLLDFAKKMRAQTMKQLKLKQMFSKMTKVHHYMWQ